MSAPGLPDGCLPHMLPGNSLASELCDRHWEANRREVEAQARRELALLCAVPGAVRNGYLEYCADHGVTSILEYVATLERINAGQWVRTVDLIFQQQFAWDEQ